MSTKIGDILKVNVPEFLQGMKELDEYLEVCGEVMDDAHSGIRALADIKHYGRSEDGLVELNLREMGFDVPANVKLGIKRQILRDVAQIHLRRGTEDAIMHLLRIVGVSADSSKGWLLNPDMAKKGYKQDFFTRQKKRFDPNDRTYIDFLYGDVVDTEDGSFFEGYSYWDVDKERSTGLIPIYGEIYEHTGTLGTDTVGSTPYMTIRFSDEDDSLFLVEDEEYIDPETGEVFEYTVDERFTLLEDIIRFFLIGEYRPTTMRIIIEAKIVSLDDTLYIGELYKKTIIDTTDPRYSDRLTVGDSYTIDNVIDGFDAQDTTVGSGKLLIGLPTPLRDRWMGVELQIGQTTGGQMRIIDYWDELETLHHLDQYTKVLTVPLFGDGEIDLVGLTGVTVMGDRYDGASVPISSGSLPPDLKSVTLTTPQETKQTFTMRRLRR